MTPVLLIAYRRSDLTKRVLSALREAQPTSLFVAFDGPKPGEEVACRATRDAVAAAVDWSCELKTLVREENLGCREAVSQAINWFFERVPDGVILEDDTVPTLSFLRYAEELLERYRSNERIAMISGTNLLAQWPSTASYFFGDGGIWGWATWRRAWEASDASFSLWEDRGARRQARAFYGEAEWRRLRPAFEAVRRGDIDTWDYQWSFARAARGQFSTIPAENLVSNIGFRNDATHTHDPSSVIADLPVGKLEYPLVHPIRLDFERDYQRAARQIQAAQPASFVRRAMGRARRTLTP